MGENSFDMKRPGSKADGMTVCFCGQTHGTDCQDLIGPSGYCAAHSQTCLPSLNTNEGVCALHSRKQPCEECAADAVGDDHPEAIEAIHRIKFCAGHYLKFLQSGGDPDRWMAAEGGMCGVPECHVQAARVERPFLVSGVPMMHMAKTKPRIKPMGEAQGHG